MSDHIETARRQADLMMKQFPDISRAELVGLLEEWSLTWCGQPMTADEIAEVLPMH